MAKNKTALTFSLERTQIHSVYSVFQSKKSNHHYRGSNPGLQNGTHIMIWTDSWSDGDVRVVSARRRRCLIGTVAGRQKYDLVNR